MLVLLVSFLVFFFEFLIVMYAYDVFNLDEEFFILVSLLLWLCVFIFNFLKDSLELIQNYLLLDAFEVFFFHDRRTMLSSFFYLQCIQLLKLHVSLDNFFNLFGTFLPKAICMSKLSQYNQDIISFIYSTIATFGWFIAAYENNHIRILNLIHEFQINFEKNLYFDVNVKTNPVILATAIISKALKVHKPLRSLKVAFKTHNNYSQLFLDGSSTPFLSNMFTNFEKLKGKSYINNIETLESHVNTLRLSYCLNSLGTSSLRYNENLIKLNFFSFFSVFDSSDLLKNGEVISALFNELSHKQLDFVKNSAFTGLDFILSRRNTFTVFMITERRIFSRSSIFMCKPYFFKYYKFCSSF